MPLSIFWGNLLGSGFAFMLTSVVTGPLSTRQSFAEAPVVRSYPEEQSAASLEPATAPAPSYSYSTLSGYPQQTGLAPASAFSPVSEMAYRGLPAFKATGVSVLAPASALAYRRMPAYQAAPPAIAYRLERPSADASGFVLAPGPGPELSAVEPGQAPSMQPASGKEYSATSAYAPRPEPHLTHHMAPFKGGKIAPALAPGPTSAMRDASILPNGPLSAPVSAPAPVPAAYGHTLAMRPYAAYGHAASMQGASPGTLLFHRALRKRAGL